MEHSQLWAYLTASAEATCWEYKESKAGKMHRLGHVTALQIIAPMCDFGLHIGIKPIIEILPAFCKVKSN